MNLGFASPYIIILSTDLTNGMQQLLKFITCRFNTAQYLYSLFVCTQLDEQRESTHNSINRDKATCPDKVMPRNNNKAKSNSAK
jgi:hypothetical protein